MEPEGLPATQASHGVKRCVKKGESWSSRTWVLKHHPSFFGFPHAARQNQQKTANGLINQAAQRAGHPFQGHFGTSHSEGIWATVPEACEALRSCSTNFRGLQNEKQTHDLANSTMSNPDGPTLQLSASEHLPYALYFSGDCPSGVHFKLHVKSGRLHVAVCRLYPNNITVISWLNPHLTQCWNYHVPSSNPWVGFDHMSLCCIPTSTVRTNPFVCRTNQVESLSWLLKSAINPHGSLVNVQFSSDFVHQLSMFSVFHHFSPISWVTSATNPHDDVTHGQFMSILHVFWSNFHDFCRNSTNCNRLQSTCQLPCQAFHQASQKKGYCGIRCRKTSICAFICWSPAQVAAR